MDILRNAFALALGCTVLAETLVLVPAFFLEWGEPGLIPSGVSLLGLHVCQELRLFRTKRPKGEKASRAVARRLHEPSRILVLISSLTSFPDRISPDTVPPESFLSKSLRGFGALTVPELKYIDLSFSVVS